MKAIIKDDLSGLKDLKVTILGDQIAKLAEVTEKICSLLKWTDLDPMLHVQYTVAPIREAEVLMVFNHNYAIDGDGEFLTECIGDSGHEESGVFWKLGKPLSEQSEETITFLHKVLCDDVL